MADKNLKGPRPKKIQKILTSEQTYTRTRKEINRLNRERAKRMEARIAKYLGGERVYGSGAIAKHKGDCKIPIDKDRTYYVECKLSEMLADGEEPALKIISAWFPEMQKNVKSMDSMFGILVIHYHLKKGDYVFIRPQDLELILNRVSEETSAAYKGLMFITLLEENALNTTQNKSGKMIKSYVFRHSVVDKFKKVNNLLGLGVLTLHGMYLCMPIEQFKQLMIEFCGD